jgi:hypothetical protein
MPPVTTARRYPWQQFRLAAMKKGLGWYLEHRFEKADAARS